MSVPVDKERVSAVEDQLSVVEEFEARVDRSPDGTAVVTPAGLVSFAELDGLANVIANELIARLGPDPEPIPLLIGAPHLMLGAMVGSLKAGKFYAAVNPRSPWPRNQQILAELGARIQLMDGPEMGTRSGDYLDVSAFGEESSVSRPDLRFDSSRLAYVVYTSGSSGRPRGIAHSRAEMLHNLKRHQPLQVNEGDRLTLISSDGFINAVSNPFLGLVRGAGLAPYSFRDSGVKEMINWLQRSKVTVVYAFPSFLRQLLASQDPAREYQALRLIYLGGETVLPSDLEAARRLFPKATIAIGLNSSETGLTCLQLVSATDELPNPVPVGRPVEGIAVEIVDEKGEPTPPGTRGELVVRSEHVQPRLWQGGELSDALAGGQDGLRTGDRARAASDETIFHLGRCDEMVKVRGFRVETFEVEAVIAAIDGVSEVAVVGTTSLNEGHTILAAYVVVPQGGVDELMVRSTVAMNLPSAMIPEKVHFVASLPRTANGKVHRMALAANEYNGARQGSLRLPRTDERRSTIETRVAEIWATVLGGAKVAPDDNFFVLGGSSISALAVVSGIREAFGGEIPLSALFEHPTVRGLTDVVASAMEGPEEHSAPSEGSLQIRLAREEDFSGIAEIVNHYIVTTPYTFRTVPLTPENLVSEWSGARDRYPWLVALSGASVVGFAYAGRWKNRPAYNWCAEVTGYVARNRRREGIGKALYRRLIAQLDAQGYTNELAIITLPNPGSVGLHESFGFEQIGTLHRVGYKQDAWWSLGFWQRISSSLAPPGEIRPARDVWKRDGCD
jgi:acyl-coenzyme A synthetase/AMP-(fatty) acid ligase/L-amino acid N-acyltransferase YncA/acyl carrier protein